MLCGSPRERTWLVPVGARGSHIFTVLSQLPERTTPGNVRVLRDRRSMAWCGVRVSQGWAPYGMGAVWHAAAGAGCGWGGGWVAGPTLLGAVDDAADGIVVAAEDGVVVRVEVVVAHVLVEAAADGVAPVREARVQQRRRVCERCPDRVRVRVVQAQRLSTRTQSIAGKIGHRKRVSDSRPG